MKWKDVRDRFLLIQDSSGLGKNVEPMVLGQVVPSFRAFETFDLGPSGMSSGLTCGSLFIFFFTLSFFPP